MQFLLYSFSILSTKSNQPLFTLKPWKTFNINFSIFSQIWPPHLHPQPWHWYMQQPTKIYNFILLSVYLYRCKMCYLIQGKTQTYLRVTSNELRSYSWLVAVSTITSLIRVLYDRLEDWLVKHDLFSYNIYFNTTWLRSCLHFFLNLNLLLFNY